MNEIFLNITKTDCKEVSYTMNEDNGLLEITTPRNYTEKEINEYVDTLDDATWAKQKKAKEMFRKRVQEMIRIYAKDLDIPFRIDLRFLSKPKHICNGEAEVNGMLFSGRINILTVLQFCPDDIVKKIVRYAVYMVAVRYEELCCNITGFSLYTHDMLSGRDTEVCSVDVPESKYSIGLTPSEIQQIQSDYDKAFKQFIEEMNKQQICCLFR